MKRVATILFEFLFIGAVVVAGVGAAESRLHPIVGGFLLAASVWLVFCVIAPVTRAFIVGMLRYYKAGSCKTKIRK